MSGNDSANTGVSNRTLVIALSTVLSVVVVVIAITTYICIRRRSRRVDRGVTPIDDDEIATWKVNRSTNEKGPERFGRSSNVSTYTHRKAPSNTVIQYRPSLDAAPQSPRSFTRKTSFDLPQIPQPALFALAPNARSGLTDETVPGDDPFVTTPKRQPSKLHKLPPNSTPNTHRSRGSRGSRGSRSSSVRSFAEQWYVDGAALSPRASNDVFSSSRVQSRVYSTPSSPPALSSNDSEAFAVGGLSPPPLHRTEIGRALG